MFHKIIDLVAQQPAILDWLRSFLENNHRGEREVVARELPERQTQKILDLGCGTGVFSPWFGPEYVGIDLGEKYINFARARFRDKNFQVMDASKLNFPDESFDAIWVNGVLHHLDDNMVLAVAAEMRRVLKLNGRAVVMEDVPAKKIISKFIRGLDAGEHIRPPEQYRQLLAEQFLVNKEYPVRTGVCDYQVFVLTAK